MFELAALPQRRHSRTLAALASSKGEFRVRGANQLRILIVEDDFLAAADLENKLTDAGYDVVGIAVTAEAAIRIAAESKPSLAVMDIRLAGKRDGIEAAIELLTKHGIPSIFATAHGDPATRARAQRAKPLAWLIKPYSAELVVATIGEVMRGAG